MATTTLRYIYIYILNQIWNDRKIEKGGIISSRRVGLKWKEEILKSYTRRIIIGVVEEIPRKPESSCLKLSKNHKLTRNKAEKATFTRNLLLFYVHVKQEERSALLGPLREHFDYPPFRRFKLIQIAFCLKDCTEASSMSAKRKANTVWDCDDMPLLVWLWTTWFVISQTRTRNRRKKTKRRKGLHCICCSLRYPWWVEKIRNIWDISVIVTNVLSGQYDMPCFTEKFRRDFVQIIDDFSMNN